MTYEMIKYSEFFELDEGYYPEINEDSIKDPKNKWQNTFPHADIVSLLKLVERILSRADKKGIWLEGSYGTGKSRILWMLQNLLTCSDSDFDAYFEEYDNLRNEIDLRERLRACRNGKIVTAKRYATGDITSTQKLIFNVFESLTSALKQGGYKFDGAKTLRGKIASWLESDSANLEMFRAKIQKPAYRMSANLAKRSPEEIIARLKNPKDEVAHLVEDILRLGEKEGIRAFSISMQELVSWITEVIEENQLNALILFWDEFSKFFGNNRNNLDEFQRLAELSNSTPFYLVIATHESNSLSVEGDQSFRSISDRFEHPNITMPDRIAFELIGHALKIKDTAKKNWTLISAALKERTKKARQAVMTFAGSKDEKILTDILPIHPMTAVLLKNLATCFASNQRSIFNFIKINDPNVEAFQYFIATKSPENGDLLTVDYLWNFFYERDMDEHGNHVGRLNLKPSVYAILNSYGLNKENLTSEEQIVFKTLLLFQAIEQESHGEVGLFRPTEKNLELAFTGVSSMENGHAVAIANELVHKEILFKKPGKVKTFAVMARNGDLAEIERLKKDLEKTTKTNMLVENAKLTDTIKLTPSQAIRFSLHPVTVDDFKLTLNRLLKEKSNYKLYIMTCFARNSDEQYKLHNLITEAVSDVHYNRFIFLDASANHMNREIFEGWVESSANERYWRGEDNALADRMKFRANTLLKEWTNSFDTGVFVLYPALIGEGEEKRKGISCQGMAKVIDELKDNVRRLYPYSFDDANITETLYISNSLKRLAEAGISQTEFSMLKAKDIKTILGDAWQMSGNYWEVYPTLSISRLQVEVDALIHKGLRDNTRIAFDDIFAYLVSRGFMPVNIYSFLTGFLLKKYAADPYRYSVGEDGNQGGAMTPQKLAECISESIKQVSAPIRNYRPKYLELMSSNQRQFIAFATKVFGVTENESVEQCVQKIRLHLKNLKYPLWCYVDSAATKCKDFLHLLMEIANSQQVISISTLTEQAGQLLTDAPSITNYLKPLLTVQKGKRLFTQFLKNFEGGILFELAEKIGIEDVVSECQKRIATGDGLWLRDRATAEEDLKKLIVDYQIIIASHRFGITGDTFNICVENWKDFCRHNLRIPADVIGEQYSNLKPFFSILKEILLRGDIPQSKRQLFLRYLVDEIKTIAIAISDKTKIQILRSKYSYQLEGLSDEEIEKLFIALPSTSFADTQGNYYKSLNSKANELRKSQLKNELLKLWRKVMGEHSPREWSKMHRTPILAMVPKSEQVAAQKVFEAVMATSPTEKDISVASQYLKKRPSYVDALKDAYLIEKAFREVLVGEYNVVLDDNDEVRDELETKFSADAYSWYPDARVNGLLKEFAKSKYYSGGVYDKVAAQVMRMSNEDAKKLLIDLVDKNFEVGLKILWEASD